LSFKTIIDNTRLSTIHGPNLITSVTENRTFNPDLITSFGGLESLSRFSLAGKPTGYRCHPATDLTH
ncbi:MAG TPA: hypothetical protein VK666_23995, partial [Chryseolinea sp.]|nr:hypothetical protein [Chryseolinea sp.]